MLKITVSRDAVVKDVCLYVYVAIKGMNLKTQLLREWFTKAQHAGSQQGGLSKLPR